MATRPFTSKDYLLTDYPRTLFPLATTALLVTHSHEALAAYAYKRVLSDEHKEDHFPPQQRCYAAKRGHYLRRTVKLDPVAEFYIYDLVYRNRKSFRKDSRPTRRSFGYRFKEGQAESPTEAYSQYKRAVGKARKAHKQTISLDIATYFNSIYHHDLVSTSEELGWDKNDTNGLGQFLREINSGRSIDCLPHGIHPCKVLGTEFLRFIENSHKLSSALTVRFLDDIHLFAAKKADLTADLLTIQELLGDRGLSLNASKTAEGAEATSDIAANVDKIKADLLQRRRFIVIASGDEDDDEEHTGVYVTPPLTSEQTDYLISLIESADIEESDAELVLSLLRDHGREVVPRLAKVLKRFPALTKSLYNYTKFAEDQEGIDEVVRDFLTSTSLVTEYQLFWLAKLTEDFLMSSPLAGDILQRLYQHPKATPISRAKILENPDKRFGLPELREEKLRNGSSNWESWSAACGTRGAGKAKRNHLLGYFANGSPLNRLIADCVKAL